MNNIETQQITDICGNIYTIDRKLKTFKDSLKTAFSETNNKSIKLLPTDTWKQATATKSKRSQKFKNIDSMMDMGFRTACSTLTTETQVRSDYDIMQMKDEDFDKYSGVDYITLTDRKKAIIKDFGRLRRKIYASWNLPGTPTDDEPDEEPVAVQATVIKTKQQLLEGLLHICL
jgi:hypothetical protein